LRTQPKIKFDHKRRRVLVYFMFEKEIQQMSNPITSISVDINENNVTVKVRNKVFVLLTDIRKITLGYSKYREITQTLKGSKHLKRTLQNNEKNKKKDRKLKLANIITNIAKQMKAAVILERLPKKCPENMIKKIYDKKLRHRIYQAGFRTLLKTIEEKCLEKEILVVKVNPRGTSSTCPYCGSRLMRGDAPRLLYCKKCGRKIGKDVVAVLNIEKKATQKGRVPFAPMPNETPLEVAVLPMKEWMRRKSLLLTQNKPILTEMKR